MNEQVYRNLLGKALPSIIQTEEEYLRLLKAVEELMLLPEADLSEEEGRLFESLIGLIEEYEDRVYPLPGDGPRV